MPGVYTFNKINFGLLITVSNLQYQAQISIFNYEVDVDNLVQTGNAAVTNAGALAVTFANEFNTTPVVVLTIQSAQAGDLAVLTSVTASGFSVEVINSGSAVARTVSWHAQGY